MYDYVHKRDELEQSAAALFDAVRSGKVTVDIRQRFPLADAAEAHRALEGRKTSGSTILTID
jgi:NADPH2:quinone reductase